MTTVGFFNAACSLLILVLHWRLSILKNPKAMTLLVFFMTVFQFFQDVALAYQFQCTPNLQGPPLITTGYDDDAFWTADIQRDSYWRRCYRSQWFIEEFSGIMLQSLCVQMSAFLYLAVVLQRGSSRFGKLILRWNLCSGVLALIVASTNTFGSGNCNKRFSPKGVIKTLYNCPSPPGRKTKGVNYYYSPSHVAWMVSENLRLALAILSLLVCARTTHFLWNMQKDRPTKLVVIFSIIKKVIWYPVIQSCTRFPALYLTIYGPPSWMDKPINDDSFGTDRKLAFQRRLALGYTYALLAPSGGFFMLVVFLYNNPKAKAWFDETCALLLGKKSGGSSSSSSSSSDDPRVSDVSPASPEDPSSLSSSSTPSSISKSVKAVQRRCSTLDEDDLVAKVELLSLAGASEEEWQQSLMFAPSLPSTRRISLVLRRSSSGRRLSNPLSRDIVPAPRSSLNMRDSNGSPYQLDHHAPASDSDNKNPIFFSSPSPRASGSYRHSFSL